MGGGGFVNWELGEERHGSFKCRANLEDCEISAVDHLIGSSSAECSQGPSAPWPRANPAPGKNEAIPVGTTEFAKAMALDGESVTLAGGLVKEDSSGSGSVEGLDAAGHGDADAGVGAAFDLFGKTRAFVADE